MDSEMYGALMELREELTALVKAVQEVALVLRSIEARLAEREG